MRRPSADRFPGSALAHGSKDSPARPHVGGALPSARFIALLLLGAVLAALLLARAFGAPPPAGRHGLRPCSTLPAGQTLAEQTP